MSALKRLLVDADAPGSGLLSRAEAEALVGLMAATADERRVVVVDPD